MLFREGWYSKFGCTHTGVTEPVVWSGVRQVETVLTQQQFIQLEEKETRREVENRERCMRTVENFWNITELHTKFKIKEQQAPNLQTTSHCSEGSEKKTNTTSWHVSLKSNLAISAWSLLTATNNSNNVNSQSISLSWIQSKKKKTDVQKSVVYLSEFLVYVANFPF